MAFDPTKPTHANPTTADVRENFISLKAITEDLQTQIDALIAAAGVAQVITTGTLGIWIGTGLYSGSGSTCTYSNYCYGKLNYLQYDANIINRPAGSSGFCCLTGLPKIPIHIYSLMPNSQVWMSPVFNETSGRLEAMTQNGDDRLFFKKRQTTTIQDLVPNDLSSTQRITGSILYATS